MKRCDWCGIMQPTVPAVLGHGMSQEMRDVNLCVNAIAHMKNMLQHDETVHIFLRGSPLPYGTGAAEFDFDMMEHE
jgi:hypothetical protein